MSCTILSTTAGVISIVGSSFFQGSIGTMTLSHTGGVTATILPVTNLASPVGGTDLTGNAVLSVNVSGTNGGATVIGSDSTGKSVVLTNAGTDVIELGLSGSLNKTAVAGSYQLDATISCN